jgi:hypothetical protein
MESNEMMLKIVLDNWHVTLKRTNDLVDSLSDEQLMQEIAPKRNRGIYLLGHLTAVHDAMLPLLGLGEAHYPALLAPYVKEADNKQDYEQTPAQLRQYWKDVNNSLNSKMATLTAADWLDRHTAVSAEDFAKEPHRNRLNVLVSRMLHLDNHRGQPVLLKGKEE